MTSRLVVPVLLLLGTVPAAAASFDCSRATQPDEVAVCADPRLSQLDDLLGRAYAQARRSTMMPEDPARALADARLSLARRRRCGSNVPCLLSAYLGVLSDLQADGSQIAPPETISALDLAPAIPPQTPALPQQEGTCTQTRITHISGRLAEKDFDSGTQANFANHGYQVAYESVPGHPLTAGRSRADVPGLDPQELPAGRWARPDLPHDQPPHARELDHGGFAAQVRRGLKARALSIPPGASSMCACQAHADKAPRDG